MQHYGYAHTLHMLIRWVYGVLPTCTQVIHHPSPRKSLSFNTCYWRCSPKDPRPRIQVPVKKAWALLTEGAPLKSLFITHNPFAAENFIINAKLSAIWALTFHSKFYIRWRGPQLKKKSMLVVGEFNVSNIVIRWWQFAVHFRWEYVVC